MEDLITKILEQKQCEISMEVEVGKQEVDKAREKAFVYLQEHAVVDGYRKGKVPMDIIKSKFIANAEQEMIKNLVPSVISEVVVKEKLKPLFYPEVTSLDIKEDGKMVFKISIEVEPEFKVKDYKGLKLEKKEVKVTEKDADNYINEILEKSAKFEKDDSDIVQEDSFVMIDYVGKKDGIEFQGGKEKGRLLSIKNSGFIDGFADGLINMKSGETKDLNLTFPKEYHAEDLAGKEVVFTVTVNEVKKKVLPEVTDEFVKKFGMETVAEFKEKIISNLKEERENEQKRKIEEDFVNQLIEKNDISIPKTMVKNEVEYMKNETKKYYEMYGYKNFDVSKMEDNLKKEAERNIKAYYILNEIIKTEKIDATEEDFDKKLEKDVEKNKEKFTEIKKYYETNKNKIMVNIRQEKLFDFLLQNAK